MPNISLISIVDDDDSLRGSLENLIRSAGFRAQGFSSAEAFLGSNKMQEAACLILDVRMPGMSGFELQRQLAATGSHLPIIFISAHADDDPKTQALEAGAVAFLYKPFYEEELLTAIDAALKNSGE
ncbi:MAG TPA: response regulator [Chthoniobacterales bacterium]|jgi:FixJ family two-component response regulator|nr:response regulator [Chthoniobacterales bacterium]